MLRLKSGLAECPQESNPLIAGWLIFRKRTYRGAPGATSQHRQPSAAPVWDRPRGGPLTGLLPRNKG